MFRVLALDPGGRTGWASYSADDRETFQNWNFTCGTLGPGKHADKIEHLIENQRVSDYVVVCERFIPQPDNPGKHDISGKYQEVVENLCAKESIELHLQTPSQAKTFVTNPVLRRLDLWIPGKVHVHEMDAYRHLVWYLTNKLHHRTLLEIGWPRG